MDSPRPAVLFVDDEPSIVEVATMLLELAGIKVYAASDRQSAIAQLETGTEPDIIISDYRMQGGMGGVKLIRRAREQLGRELPSIIMTGDTSEGAIKATKLSNCSALRKPFDPDKLLALIEGILP
jgi:DNA-binding NtrC family response regulator